ncbi:hypothetical protein ABAC460_14735 [Asticcacaulis sp. AC460]|nr:hypothetical protein ABAC460_14735 [Asticcacaulis sp. AC460]
MNSLLFGFSFTMLMERKVAEPRAGGVTPALWGLDKLGSNLIVTAPDLNLILTFFA